MADVTSSSFWKESIGPLPMWAWIAGGVVVVYGYDVIKNKVSTEKTAQPRDTETSDSTATAPNVQRADVFVMPHELVIRRPGQGTASGNSGTNAGNPPGHGGTSPKRRKGTSDG